MKEQDFKRLVRGLTVAIISLLATFSGLHAAVPSDKASFHLFLLVGQSNMAGRGKLDDAALTPHPRVLALNKEGNWVPAVDPLHFDKPRIVGVGPGRAFAEAEGAAADRSFAFGIATRAAIVWGVARLWWSVWRGRGSLRRRRVGRVARARRTW